MNRFLIEDSFRIEARDIFVFAGEIIEGVVEAGMTFEVPEAAHKWELRVKSVELINHRDKKNLVGLVVEDASRCYQPGLGKGLITEPTSSQ